MENRGYLDLTKKQTHRRLDKSAYCDGDCEGKIMCAVHAAVYGTDKIAQELMTGNLDGRKFL